MRLPDRRRGSFRAKAFLAVFSAGCLAASLCLHGEGALDQKYGAGAGASDDILAAVPLPTGGLVLAGFFTSFDGVERWRLARLHRDGTLDSTFDPGDSSGSSPVTQLAALPDGKILAAGSFTRFAGLMRPLVVRLNPKGQVDTAFDASSAFAHVDGRVNSLQVLPDGKILVGGRFDGAASSRRQASAFLVRLLPDGAPDATFHCEPLPQNREDELGSLTVLPDRTLLVGTGTTLLHLQENGASDAGFHLPSGQNGKVMAAVRHPDGKITVALMLANGWRVLRLQPNGGLDLSFHPLEEKGSTAGKVLALTLQGDGKVLLGGTFTEVGGKRRHGLARLLENGTLDPAFEPGTGIEVIPLEEADETPEAAVRVLLPTADTGLFIAGRFDLYNGTIRHNLAKLSLRQTANETATIPVAKPSVGAATFP